MSEIQINWAQAPVSTHRAKSCLAQPDLSCRPVVYFRVLISLSNPLISWKIFARNISFILLSHVKRLPRRTRAPKAKPAPTPLIILPTHLSTKLTLAGSHYGATPAYLRYPKALKVRRVLSRPHHGKSVQPTRGARWRSASALLARSQRARSSGLRRTDSSAATGAYFSRELLLLSALDRHISADVSGILNSRTTPYFRKNFRKVYNRETT